MPRQLNVDRMRRRPQAVLDAEAQRAAREQWEAAAATPLGRLVLGMAEVLAQGLRPRPASTVPDLKLEVHVPPLPGSLTRSEQQL